MKCCRWALEISGRQSQVVSERLFLSTDDHSRVVLEKEEGDPNSDYINASYMPVRYPLPCYSAGHIGMNLFKLKFSLGGV